MTETLMKETTQEIISVVVNIWLGVLLKVEVKPVMVKDLLITIIKIIGKRMRVNEEDIEQSRSELTLTKINYPPINAENTCI